MKILLTVDPEIPVPPIGYGGIERIVDMLIYQYVKKGHEVVLCANAASNVPCKLIGWKGGKSQSRVDVIKNMVQLTALACIEKFDIIHSFSRLAYLTALLPFSVPKIMSYQREPTVSQAKKALRIAKKKSLIFTGCSNYISNKFEGIAESYTIYNGAPLHLFNPSASVNRDAPLVFLGRIEPIKGPDTAIEIAMKTNNKLLIAGNIPPEHQSFFDNKIAPFLNENIQYIGVVNDEQKNALLGNAKALLMPIKWNEPFGIVMAEAMACGTPVLGFRRGSVPEIVIDGVTGFISDTIDEMINHVSMLESINRVSVRKVAETKFSDDKISDDYLELYNTINVRLKNNT